MGDPPPPGDNVYEWLHAAATDKPPYRTNSSGGGSDKYFVIESGGGRGADHSTTYVKLDIKDQDPHYHYPNLESIANV